LSRYRSYVLNIFATADHPQANEFPTASRRSGRSTVPPNSFQV
jgi:hypothetical protein